MIDKKITMKSCIGKYAITDETLTNRGGCQIAKGTKAKIVHGSNHGLEIRTDKCVYCGQSSIISNLKRDSLTLIDSD